MTLPLHLLRSYYYGLIGPHPSCILRISYPVHSSSHRSLTIAYSASVYSLNIELLSVPDISIVYFFFSIIGVFFMSLSVPQKSTKSRHSFLTSCENNLSSSSKHSVVEYIPFSSGLSSILLIISVLFFLKISNVFPILFSFIIFKKITIC